MADIHGRTAAEAADDPRWGIICFPGDCVSPVIVFSYPSVEALASVEDEPAAS